MLTDLTNASCTRYGTQIPVATKMSILRPACYAKFKDIIDKVYDRFEQGNQAEKLRLAGPELEQFVFDTIAKTVGTTKASLLTRDIDLFLSLSFQSLN